MVFYLNKCYNINVIISNDKLIPNNKLIMIKTTICKQ